METKVMATGVEALKFASRLAEGARPIQHGSWNIPVGTIDRDQKIVIIGIAGFDVAYLREEKLCACSPQQFLHGYAIGEAASEMYRRTAWIIPASKIMFAFLMGTTIGYVGTAATVVNVSVSVVRVGVLISTHPREVELVQKNLPIAVGCLLWFRTACPVLYGKLGNLVKRGVWVAIAAFPAGISAEDWASMLGRMLGGVAALTETVPEIGEVVVKTGLKQVGLVLAKTSGVYAALHLPAWSAHGAASMADRLARALADEFKAQWVAVTPQEERAIAGELARSGQAAVSKLKELHTALDTFAPALDKLLADFANDRK